jgi:hypothetical protein
MTIDEAIILVIMAKIERATIKGDIDGVEKYVEMLDTA